MSIFNKPVDRRASEFVYKVGESELLSALRISGELQECKFDVGERVLLLKVKRKDSGFNFFQNAIDLNS